MNAPLDYYDFPNYTYFSFPNDINFENFSGEVSSHNTTDYGREDSFYDDAVIATSTGVISIFGAVGNGMVIWLLGFRIKRNPFSTYILNLAVADLGVLLSFNFIVLDLWYGFLHFFLFIMFWFLFKLMYSASQCLLTAISIDRCVVVFCPLWHQCHRPRCLPAIVCELIWYLTFLLSTIASIPIFLSPNEITIEYYQFLVNALLCLPVMMVATVAIFIKVCFKPQQHRRGKLLTIILLSLFFFILFSFPLNVIIVFQMLSYIPPHALEVPMLLTCLNSSVKPAIYILVGRQWKSRQRESMRMIFQKIFKEEDSPSGETTLETQL